LYGVNGATITCAPNGVPDSCETAADCDFDGLPNFCEIQGGSPDLYGVVGATVTCAPNGVPDSCENAADCDSDGLPDFCEIQGSAPDNYGVAGTTITCTPNGVPDSCEPVPDCDRDGIPDFCEIQAGAPDTHGVATCTPDGIPDVCQPTPDCDDDGIPDFCEILAGATDCDQNGVPDTCQPDCDNDGVADPCEDDCNMDGTPDDCQTLPDCNGNGIPDVCDLQQPGAQDCDSNGVPDECQTDCDGNMIPDVCDIALNPQLDGDGDGQIDSCACQPRHRREPGSLLLFPEYDNRQTALTLYTVTNVHPNTTVDVHFIFIDSQTCLEFDFTRRLTAKDTITLRTRAVNPSTGQGFAYAYATETTTGRPIAFDFLIGQLLAIDGITALGYSVNAVAFKGIGEGGYTDVDDDGNRDLNGIEYSEAPDQILIPRFLGQSEDLQSELVLVALSGGAQFTTTLAFLAYNDNEEALSFQHSFQCWERIPLLDLNSLFGNAFLQRSTVQNPLEIIGMPTRESGWIRIEGKDATSANHIIKDPAFYAVLIERTGVYKVADLPFELCSQANGSLWPEGLDGDNND
jgi:hypothetical protein